MNLMFVIQELTGFLKRRISYADIALALNVTRQYVGQIKDKDLSIEQIRQIDRYFGTNFEKINDGSFSSIDDECVIIPVRGEVKASMGYGVTIYNEQQTATYSVSRKLIRDLGINNSQTEIIFAQGDSMLPTIEGGDSLLVDYSRTDIYDGKIYCVRIEGQLYAKRLQKIPPNKVVVVSDNPKYRSFEIDLSKQLDFDFLVIGEIRWWGRVARWLSNPMICCKINA